MGRSASAVGESPSTEREMASIAPERPQVRTSPTAHQALREHLEHHPDDRLVHRHNWDVSRSDIYAENRWEPTLKEIHGVGPPHYLTESPFRTFEDVEYGQASW